MTLIYEPPEEKLMLQMPKVYDDFLLNSRYKLFKDDICEIYENISRILCTHSHVLSNHIL